ncbi:unnamed protein product, partial [Mesorhabditis spiculigera]
MLRFLLNLLIFARFADGQSSSTSVLPMSATSTQIFYTSPAPDPDAKGTLRIGFMVADSIRATEIGFSQSAGVISLALDELRAQNILTHWNIEFFLNFTECNETLAAGTAVEMLTLNDVQAIIGPPCNQAIFPVAVISSYYRIPQFAWGYSNANAYSDVNRFPYLSIITPNSLQYGYALVSIMQKYQWNQVGIVYSTDEVAYCDNMISDFETAIADPTVYNIDIMTRASVNSLNASFIDPVMPRLKSRARVFLLCFMSDYRYRQFFISAYRNNMTSSEYVYIGLKMGGYGFAANSYVNSTTVDRSEEQEVITVSDGQTPIWVDGYYNNADGMNDKAKQVAARTLILDIQRTSVTASGLSNDDYRKAVLTRLRDYPFYCATLNCTNNLDTGDAVAVYTSYLHDAFFQWAILANKSIAANNGQFDLTQMIQMMGTSAASFNGYSGNVEMTSNGTRSPQFFLYGLDNIFQQKLFLNISPTTIDSYYMEAIMKSSLEFDGFFMYSLIRDIVAGLTYIHKSSLQLHGKLNSHVCMIDDRWQLKISGYGLTSLKEVTKEETYNGLLWSAPEILRGQEHVSKKADVYAFAIVASQVMTRRSAFDIENRAESAEEIVYAVKKGLNPAMRPKIDLPAEVDMSPAMSVEPESYEMVTIFFCDVVKFTVLAAKCTPLQIVNMLNELYSTFDQVVENNSVYKVETIGDAYLCVSGLPVRNGLLHVKCIADMSLDFLETVKGFRIGHMPQERMQLRIGMHSGPCVAGVVGLTMPRYCLFGDTVNTASRMESNGKPSHIHVSADAHALLSQFPGYEMEARGEVIIKGKGIMETYWLLGKHD